MSTRYLTAPQALRAVAEKIINAGFIESGLCWELVLLSLARRISYAEYLRAQNAIEEQLDERRGFLAPIGTEHKARAMFALLLAEQLESDEP